MRNGVVDADSFSSLSHFLILLRELNFSLFPYSLRSLRLGVRLLSYSLIRCDRGAVVVKLLLPWREVFSQLSSFDRIRQCTDAID